MTEREYKNPRTDARPTQTLIEEILNDSNGEKGRDNVTILHFRGSREVLEASGRLLDNPEPKRRELGADILGQLGVPVRTFPKESFAMLADALKSETDPAVIAAIAIAFGHLENPAAIPLLLPFASHPEPDVRHGVTIGLMGHPDQLAIDALIRFTRDESDEVRDWATFALGTQLDHDDEHLRSVLIERLDDTHPDTRCEALVGLARRKDKRALGALVRELESDEVGSLAIEAAELLADRSLVNPLTMLQQEHPEWEELQVAIEACRSGKQD